MTRPVRVDEPTWKRVAALARLYGKSSLTALYLLTIGWGDRRRREVLRSMVVQAGLWRLQTKLPAIGVETILAAPVTYKVREPAATPANVNLYELCLIGALVARDQPTRILEIGTYDGRTTLNLAHNAPSDAAVFTLDLPGADTHQGISLGARFRGDATEAKITQLLGDSTKFDFSSLRGTVDFIFIDGSHEYEKVRRDSLTAMTLLRDSRGTILWHDYGAFGGPTRALDDLFRVDPRFKDVSTIQGTSLAYWHAG